MGQGCESVEQVRERLRMRIQEQQRKLRFMGAGHAYAHEENGRLHGLRDAYSVVTGLPAP